MAAPVGMVVDHIDGDALNCRRSNLRLATNRENVRNQKPKPGRFKGITRYKGRWMAQIMTNYRNKVLGMFDTPEAAARAYDAAARVQHGEFARLNFPEVARV